MAPQGAAASAETEGPPVAIGRTMLSSTWAEQPEDSHTGTVTNTFPPGDKGRMCELTEWCTDTKARLFSFVYEVNLALFVWSSLVLWCCVHLWRHHSQPVSVQEAEWVPVTRRQAVEADLADPLGYFQHVRHHQHLKDGEKLNGF